MFGCKIKWVKGFFFFHSTCTCPEPLYYRHCARLWDWWESNVGMSLVIMDTNEGQFFANITDMHNQTKIRLNKETGFYIMCERTLDTGLELSSMGVECLEIKQALKGWKRGSEMCLRKETHTKVSGFQATEVWKAESIPKQGKSQTCKRVPRASKKQGH